MSTYDRTLNLIRRGRDSSNPTLLTNIPKLDEVIFGIKQGTYYLLGGDTGTGKSSFVRSTFIHNVYEQYKRINDPSRLDVQFVDFSLEISAEMNMGTGIIRKIFQDYERVITVNRLFGWTDDRLTEAELSLVESNTDYFREFQRKSLIIDTDTTPELFHDVLMEVAERNGRFEREGRNISQRGRYTSTNPNLHVIVAVDTVNLAEGNGHAKFLIDQMSRTAIKFRNICNFIFVFVQQFNSDIATTDRSRYGITTPILKDFMDSSGPTKDATIVLGLYSPIRYMKEDQTMFKGYDINILKNWMVSMHILKNRYGQINKFIPLKFDGAVGVFSQLPASNLMTEAEYLRATHH